MNKVARQAQKDLREYCLFLADRRPFEAVLRFVYQSAAAEQTPERAQAFLDLLDRKRLTRWHLDRGAARAGQPADICHPARGFLMALAAVSARHRKLGALKNLLRHHAIPFPPIVSRKTVRRKAGAR